MNLFLELALVAEEERGWRPWSWEEMAKRPTCNVSWVRGWKEGTHMPELAEYVASFCVDCGSDDFPCADVFGCVDSWDVEKISGLYCE